MEIGDGSPRRERGKLLISDLCPHPRLGTRDEGIGTFVGRRLTSDNLRQPPIHHQDFTILADHDVGRLQIAMDDPFRVRERYGIADFLKDCQQVR